MTLARFSFKKLSIFGNIWVVASVKELRNNCLSVTRVNSPVTCLTVTQPKATTAKRERICFTNQRNVARHHRPHFHPPPPEQRVGGGGSTVTLEDGRDVSKTWGVSQIWGYECPHVIWDYVATPFQPSLISKGVKQ